MTEAKDYCINTEYIRDAAYKLMEIIRGDINF